MKRRKMLILLCGVILFLTCGCSSDTKELEDRIKILENKIDKLEENKKSITNDELVGTWKTSNGYILTFKEDGTYTSTENENWNYAYKIINTGLITCVHGKEKIKSCFSIDENKVEKLGATTYYTYSFCDNKLTLFDLGSMFYDEWTKIN